MVANVWHELSRDGIEGMPAPVTLGSKRDRPWRHTAAFEAFQNTDRGLSFFTSASATAALGLLVEDQMWTAIEMSAYEFEDVALMAGVDGEGGFQLDVVQSYTERGEKVATAGAVDEPIPRGTVPGEVMSATRAWDAWAAAEKRVLPRWAAPSSFDENRERFTEYNVRDFLGHWGKADSDAPSSDGLPDDHPTAGLGIRQRKRAPGVSEEPLRAGALGQPGVIGAPGARRADLVGGGRGGHARSDDGWVRDLPR